MATGILQLPIQLAGTVGVFPNLKFMVTADNLATITTAGYLNQVNLESNPITTTDILQVLYSFNQQTNVGTYGVFSVSIASATGKITLASIGGSMVQASTSSAAPGTMRAITGATTGTATVMTSGNLVGTRGEVDVVGASGGFLYGAQGKVIPTGTLSGSSWTAGVFGQFDLSHATINAGQTAPVWADYGATGGTFTDATGMRMFSGTNTISSLTLFAMDYRYGKATNLLELDGSSSTYITSGGSGAPGGTVQKIAISIDGTTYYLVASTTVT